TNRTRKGSSRSSLRNIYENGLAIQIYRRSSLTTVLCVRRAIVSGAPTFTSSALASRRLAANWLPLRSSSTKQDESSASRCSPEDLRQGRLPTFLSKPDRRQTALCGGSGVDPVSVDKALKPMLETCHSDR